jgi:hypothetical protein
MHSAGPITIPIGIVTMDIPEIAITSTPDLPMNSPVLAIGVPTFCLNDRSVEQPQNVSAASNRSLSLMF